MRWSGVPFPCGRIVPFLCVTTCLTVYVSAAPDLRCERLEEWMPPDVIGIGKLYRLGEHLDRFLSSKLRRSLMATPAGKDIAESEKYRAFLGELSRFREVTGKKPEELISDLLGTEIAVGVRVGNGEPEIIVMTRSRGKEKLEESLQTIRKAIVYRFGGWPFHEIDRHEGIAIHGADNVAYATLGDVLAVSNRVDPLKRVIDIAKGNTQGSVRSSEAFSRVLPHLDSSRVAVVAVRPKLIPNFGLPEKLDNFLGGLIAGGWVGLLNRSELLTASLELDPDGARLDLASVTGSGELGRHESFFPEVVPSSVARRLEKRGVLGFIEIHRDFAGFWERAEDLVEPGGIGEMRQFSQVMNVIFGGKSFQDEVLPELLPSLTVVFGKQSYEGFDSKPQPAIPGFAGILEMKNPEVFQRRFRIALQTLVGILNADMASKGQAEGMFLLEPETVKGVKLYTVRRGEGVVVVDKPGLEYNFSPSLAFVGKRIILSSSRELAKFLVEVLSRESREKQESARRLADRLLVNARQLEALARDNLRVFIAGNMTKKGQSEEEARAEIESAIGLLDFVRDLRLEGRLEGDTYRLGLNLRLTGNGAGDASPGDARPSGSTDRSRKKVRL